MSIGDWRPYRATPQTDDGGIIQAGCRSPVIDLSWRLLPYAAPPSGRYHFHNMRNLIGDMNQRNISDHMSILTERRCCSFRRRSSPDGGWPLPGGEIRIKRHARLTSFNHPENGPPYKLKDQGMTGTAHPHQRLVTELGRGWKIVFRPSLTRPDSSLFLRS